jgi:hypothetical protein
MARISELVKTYKLLNDPQSPSWSVKFVGSLAIIALVVAGGAAIVWGATHDQGAAPNHLAATTADNGDGSKTDKLYLADFDAALAPDYAALDGALAAWEAHHPGAQIISRIPLYDTTHVHTIGYEIHYR